MYGKMTESWQCTCCTLLAVTALLITRDVRVTAQSSGTVPAALFEYLERVKTGAAPMPTAPQSPSQPAPQERPPPPSIPETEMYSRFVQMVREQQQQGTAPAPPPPVQPQPPPTLHQSFEPQPPLFDPFGPLVQQQQQQPQPVYRQQQPAPSPHTLQLPPKQLSIQPQQPAAPPKPEIQYTSAGTIDFVPAEHRAVQPPAPPPPRPAPVPTHSRWGFHPTTAGPSYYQRQSYTPAVDWGAHAANTHTQMSYTFAPPHKPTSWVSQMVLTPSMYNNLMAQARQSGLTRHYEEHGCIDPIMHMPPGSNTVGLAMGCNSPVSKQLCQMVGNNPPGAAVTANNNMAMMMMFAPPHMKQLLESCLSQTSLTKAMMMMNMMNNRNNQQTHTTSTSDAGSLPAGAALPGSEGTQLYHQSQGQNNQGQGESMTNKCASILPLVMMQGEGGIMSPEGGDIVRDLRRQIFPYTCQEVGAGVMPVRMCCPGKVNDPSMFEFISSVGAGAK